MKIIFSFFLGLMLAVFVGVGVYTFNPSPEEAFQPRMEALDQEIEDLRGGRPDAELTAQELQRSEELRTERERIGQEAREASRGWAQATSVILIVFATLIMAVSLVRSESLPVLSNGLLLGGLFTMVYGVGWIIASESSMTRFLVMTVALAVTLVLGYMRFVGGRPGPPEDREARAPRVAGSGATLEEMDRRLRTLEQRMERLAEVLRGG